MNDYNKRLLAIITGIIIYTIFFLLDWFSFKNLEFELDKEESFIFEFFETGGTSRETHRAEMALIFFSLVYLSCLWFFRQSIGNKIHQIFQNLKNKI